MKFQPSINLKTSYWFEQAEPFFEEPQRLNKHHHTDIAIIGGGFVGLWTALNIKQKSPQTRVSILEKDVCGGGASGRNGGMAMSWWPKIGTLLSFCSKEQALFLAQSSEQAIYDLGKFCQENGIEAEFRMDGWLWTATTPKHIDSWNSTLKACEELGVKPFEHVSPEHVSKRAGSKVHLAGVFEKNNATLQPAILVRGLRKVALKMGVEIFERTPVEFFEQKKDLYIKTPHAEVYAQKLVLATNAWSSSIPELAQMITPVNSAIVVTDILEKELNQMGLSDGVGITDCQLMVDYYRTTLNKRLVFGKGTGALSYGSHINEIFSKHSQSIDLTVLDLKRTYPLLANTPITNSWSGPIDRTYDSLPIFGHLKGLENVVYGIGWSGNGVSPSQIGGKILSSLALNIKDEWSTCALVNRKVKKFPPEPFRYIGGNMVRNAVIRKEKREIIGQEPHKFDLYLAKLAPAGLEDKS